MARHRRRFGRLAVTAVVGVVVSGAAIAVAAAESTTTTTTTTTTIPIEQPQAGWTVVTTGARGVMVDQRQIASGGVIFSVARFRAATTSLSWHPGSEDPPNQPAVLAAYGNHINWTTEGAAGVVGVFNSAFKTVANAGGWQAGTTVISAMRGGYATLMIDATGHWKIINWLAHAVPVGYKPVIIRQNLQLLVSNGAPTPESNNPSQQVWGGSLHGYTAQTRTAVGVDANGNLIYVASMGHALPVTVARVLVAAGVVTGMELDINPYWPIMGLATTPIKSPAGKFTVSLPGSEHLPTVYETGWTRDFFVVTQRQFGTTSPSSKSSSSK